MRAARLFAPTRHLALARMPTRRFTTAPAGAVPASLLDVEDGVPPTAAAAPATDAAASGLDTAAAASAVAGTTDAVAGAVSHAGASLGYWPPDLALRLVDAVHSGSELPWWSAIAASALLCRTLLLPLALYGTRLGARMQELKQPVAELQARHAGGAAGEAAAAAELQALYQAHGVSPMRMLALPLVQLPVFLSCFVGLKRLTEAFPAAHEGGAFWFTDLGAAPWSKCPPPP